jgi:hypothetical protein
MSGQALRERVWCVAGKLLSCVILATWLLAAASGSAQDTLQSGHIVSAEQGLNGDSPANDGLELLRDGVHAAQLSYLENLTGPGTSNVSEYIELLRAELKKSVRETLNSSTQSEVLLALKRAAVNFKVEKINALEQAVGDPAGLLTTRWNVFTRTELAELDRSLRSQYSQLLIESARYSVASTPLQLVGRIAEVGTELDALVAELMARADRELAPLRQISHAMTLAEAEKGVQLLTIPDSVRAERALRFEVEQGLHWHPKDPALKALSSNFRSDPMRSAVLRLVAEEVRPTQWPPPREPPTSGFDRPPPAPMPGPTSGNPGPGRSPAGDIIADLSQAAKAELNGSRNGDPLELADARARLNVSATWVRIATGTPQDARQLAVAAMTDTELRQLREGYQHWFMALQEAKQGTLQANWHGEAELIETRAWIAATDAEIHIRGPPPTTDSSGLHSPSEIRRVIDGPPPADSPELSAFQDTQTVALERDRLAELRTQLDLLQSVPNIALENAYQIQQARVLAAEAKLVNEVQQRTGKALASTLKHARGGQAEEAGYFLTRTHDDLRAYGQALQQQIDTVRARASGREARRLLSVRVNSALLTPPPANKPYRPEALGRIAFTIRAAEETSVIPRAPPLVVEMPAPSNLAPIQVATTPTTRSSAGVGQLSRTGVFDQLFTDSSARSYTDLIRDVRLAPGGVIVDVRLPPDLAEKIRGAGYNVRAHSLWVNVDDHYFRVMPAPDPLTARAALAFSLDQRVAAADIRPASDTVATEFLRSLPPYQLALRLSGHEQDLYRELLSLSEVNLNPALTDTGVGEALIHADEIIFNALGNDDLLLARNSLYRGLPISEIRARRDADLRSLQVNPNSSALKSILSAVQTKVSFHDDKIVMEFPLRYEVFYIPGSGHPQKLETLSNWLEHHDQTLKTASPELRKLVSFAAAVAIFRTALEKNVIVDSFELAELVETEETPHFLCRGSGDARSDSCQLPYLRGLVE